MKRESAEWLACMAVASIGLVYSLWVVPYIPTSDGPQHIFFAHVENHYSDAGSSYPEYYRVLPQYAGKGFALVFGPLESILPWRVALRVTFSLLALAFAWGFALVVLLVDRSRRPTSMLGFLIALPWSLYMGFFPFVVGTTLGLYTLAFVLHRPPTTPGRRGALSLLLLVQAVCHVFSAIVTGIIVTVLVTMAAKRERRLRELGTMALVGAPAAALFALTFRGIDLPGSAQQLVRWSHLERLSEISRWFVPGPGLRGWFVIALVVVGIGTALTRARQGTATPPEGALGWLSLSLFLLTWLAPLHIPGWSFLAPRLAVMAMVLALALVRLPESVSPRVARAAVPLVTVGCLVSSFVSASLHRQLAEGCSDALSGLDAPLHFEGPRLPFVFEPFCGTPRAAADSPIPGATMAANTPSLYLLDHGGIAIKIFNGAPSIHAIEILGARLPPFPDEFADAMTRTPLFSLSTQPELRASVLTELAADGMPFEGIHVVGGRADDFAAFRERGYVTELESRSLFIARFEGCPSELVLPEGALDHEAVYYEYGLFSERLITPRPRVLARSLVKREPAAKGGPIHVPLAGRPCGRIWVRVFWDADRSSSLTPGDRTCTQALPDGRVLATVQRGHPAVECTPQVAAP